VAEKVDIDSLKSGQSLHFEVSKTEDGGYEITGIHIMSEPEVSSETVSGLINAIDIDTRILNISRGPIEKWDRPAATMDFIVANNIEMVDFNVGDNVTFTFEVRDDLVITDISLESDEQHGKENKAAVDHSNH
jgi:Cu(I)/Ag(I) efflux system membrane fusion protein